MFWTVTVSLLEGFGKTLELFALTLLFALPLGLILSFGSMSRFKPLKWLVKTLIWVIRGTPLMLQLIVIYYGPGLLASNAEMVENPNALISWVATWSVMDRFVAALVAFVINYACYFSEIYRGGIESISKGTSLARIIAVYEIIWAGQAFIKSAGILWPLFYTGVFYLAFNGLLTLLFGYIEKKLSYFRG